MQLAEIPVSHYMKTPRSSLIVNLDLPDASYFLDLKRHLDKDPEYIKARIAWRKEHTELRLLSDVKDQFFVYYRETTLQTFHRDVFYFVRNNPNVSSDEGAKMFCDKWKGYGKTYGVEFVRRAIERCQFETMQ